MSMNTNNNKDLNELLGSLFAADEAGKVRKDIRKGDELFAKNPVPLPRPELLADIRTQMLLAHHRRRKAHRSRYLYGSVAMAATVTIVCGLAWFIMVGATPADLGLPVEPAYLTPITENIQSVTAQLDQIADTIAEVDSETTVPVEYQTDIANLETSLWKG
jgi:hypothetical protein